MEVYWQEVRRGQRLVLDDDSGDKEIGGVRETKRGFDAFAKTFGYDPGRAKKDIQSMCEAKEFVESFRPWEIYQLGEDVAIEPGVRPRLD